MKVTKNMHDIVKGADPLSLGISIVVAIGIGFGVGYWLKKMTGSDLLFFFFIFVGFGAAFLNVYKVFKAHSQSMKELEEDPKYKNYKPDFKDIEEEEDQW